MEQLLKIEARLVFFRLSQDGIQQTSSWGLVFPSAQHPYDIINHSTLNLVLGMQNKA